VTGAAGGIGTAIAAAIASTGALLALADQDGERLERLSHELDGVDPVLCVGDIRDPGVVASWLDRLLDSWGAGPDGLVNCAGVFSLIPTLELSPEEWERTLAVNLTGLFHSCRVFGRTMVEAEAGAIVNIGSLSGMSGRASRAAYVSSKHGVHGLSKALAAEWGPYGVRVNCLAPGRIETVMGADSFIEDAPRQGWLARTPLRRFGSPAEVAGPALFLLSAMSSYVNGQELAVDGGYISSF
jgi:NAD(P)-dependent dehydrogenase (short-subunit alcohol dehydrogenase family)